MNKPNKSIAGAMSVGVALLFILATTSNATVTTCTHARFNEAQDLGCPKKCGPCDGMPQWWVTEPYENLWIADEPLSYYTSDGQKMTFRWTYQQRGQLSGALRIRELRGTGEANSGAADIAHLRYREQYRYGMTNAAWCHNWWSEIVFWDPGIESGSAIQQAVKHETDASNHPVRAYRAFTSLYEGMALLGDGGTVFFNAMNASTPTTQTKLRFEVIGSQAAGGPEVPVLNDSGYPNPYPESGEIWVEDPKYGFRMIYPDGSIAEYGFVHSVYQYRATLSTQCPYRFADAAGNNVVISAQCGASYPPKDFTTRALLTRHIDSQGRVTRIGYLKNPALAAGRPNYVVKYVVDPDGRTNTYNYNSEYTQIASIEDPYGRTARFNFASRVYPQPFGVKSDVLKEILDAEGMKSTFEYQQTSFTMTRQVNGKTVTQVITVPLSGWIESMTTPYGTTLFNHFEEGEGDAYSRRAILVAEQKTDTEWARQLFLYKHNCQNVGETSTPEQTVPTVSGVQFDDSTHSGGDHPNLYYRNSYHWGRRQFTAISGAQSGLSGLNSASWVVNNLLNSAAEYRKARLKHWMRSSSDEFVVVNSMSSEREPSPDSTGTTAGIRTFYAYKGQAANMACYEGTEPYEYCVARRLPDGTTQYQLLDYNSLGNPTMQRGSYTKFDGTIDERTNRFEYYANSTDVKSISNSIGFWAGFTYNSSHQVTYSTNALRQWNKLTYQNKAPGAVDKLVGAAFVPGEVATLNYYGYQSPTTEQNRRFLSSISWATTGRQWDFSYEGGLIKTASDDLGLTMNYTWDNLLRLTGAKFPDQTYISNRYDKLDLFATRDRLGNWTYFGYDGLRNLRAITNAMGYETYLSWCSCGSLDSIADALSHVTHFTYNNQGRLTDITYPDNSSLHYQYDNAGRATLVWDVTARYLRFTYNNQNLVTNIDNAYGRVARFVYDKKDRPIEITDAMGITVTNEYDVLDRLIARSWPDHMTRKEGFLYETNGLVCYTNRNLAETWYARDDAGRLLRITNANNKITYLGYDSASHLTSLIDALNQPTTWDYDIYGLVKKKLEKIGGATREVLRYTYDPDGRLTNRWALATGDTEFIYDLVHNLTNVNYKTPDFKVKYKYDAVNQLTEMVDGVGTTTFSYSDAGRLLSEDGPWNYDTVSYTYNQGLRKTLSLLQPSVPAWEQTYGYDNAWRMNASTAPSGTFGYDYGVGGSVSPASVIRAIALPNSAKVVNTYDGMGRLETTSLLKSGQTLDAATYTYDLIGQRTNVARNFGMTSSEAALTYDALGQLRSWKAKEADGSTLRLNELVGYAYDDVGNLHHRTNNDGILTFNANELNELSSVTRLNNLFTYSGATPTPGTSVSVNSINGNYYNDGTFAVPGLTLQDGNNTLDVLVAGSGNRNGSLSTTLNLPSTVNYTYDNNGNMTGDGLKTFQYDWENQLTNITVANAWKADFTYDGLGRRRIIKEYQWQSGSWGSPVNEVRYVYDRNLVIQERGAANQPLVTYTRGLDLSETLQGAGGIGGLLARTDADGSLFYHSDGAGNITTLLDANRNMAARYLYDPFGNLVGQWGAKAGANHYRFSSKEVHPNSGLYYYGYRFYEPNLQRWLNRDSIGERGGINMFGFTANSPVNMVDVDGRWYGYVAKPLADFIGEGSANSSDPAAGFMGSLLEDVLNAAASLDPFYSSIEDAKELNENGLEDWAGQKYADLEEAVGTANIVRAVDFADEYSPLEQVGYATVGAAQTFLCVTAPLASPKKPLKGTNEKGKVTSRTKWRKQTLQDSWDEAAPGPTGGKLCPDCKAEVKVPPGEGPRDWDNDHQPKWTEREFPPNVSREDVIDNYQQGTRLRCRPCNRADNH